MVTLADRAGTCSGSPTLLARTVSSAIAAPRVPVTPQLVWTRQPVGPHPGEAFFARHAVVPAGGRAGLCRAGGAIPTRHTGPLPGERVDEEVVAALPPAQAAGTRIAYAADPTLATTLRVVG